MLQIYNIHVTYLTSHMLQIYNITCHISHITYPSIIQYHISHHILQTYKVMSHNVMLNYILSSDQNVRYDMTSRYQMRRWHKCKKMQNDCPTFAIISQCKEKWMKESTFKQTLKGKSFLWRLYFLDPFYVKVYAHPLTSLTEIWHM